MQQRTVLEYWLALYHAPGIGPTTIHKLHEQVGDISLLFNSSLVELKGLQLPSKVINYCRHPDWASVEADLKWALQGNNQIISYQCPDYPPMLHTIPDPPPVLYLKGNVKHLSLPQLALVGTRMPTMIGNESAYAFAKQLAAVGMVVTSGLALGIDGASHRGALAAKGITHAVLGTGLDLIYPKAHEQLAQQIIASGGALISEFPPTTQPRPENFPRRNRIISGLSLGVLVVEAALKSGSLITARLALEQGRDVFAIPGSIHNPMAKGCHVLLRQGAKLVQSVSDIIEEIAPQLASILVNEADGKTTNVAYELDQSYHKLLECLGFEPTPIDIIIKRSQMPANQVTAMLLELELKGIITKQVGGYEIAFKSDPER